MKQGRKCATWCTGAHDPVLGPWLLRRDAHRYPGAAVFDCGGDNSTPWGNCFLWTPPAGITFTDSPAITALGDQRLIVGACGSDGQGWMKEWNAGRDTGPWVAMGGGLAGAAIGLASW